MVADMWQLAVLVLPFEKNTVQKCLFEVLRCIVPYLSTIFLSRTYFKLTIISFSCCKVVFFVKPATVLS